MSAILKTLNQIRSVLLTGVATGGTLQTLIDSTATNTNFSKELIGKLLLIVAGTGANQARRIIGVNQQAVIAQPATPTVTPTGVPGATTYTYVVTAVVSGYESAGSPAGSTTTGNAVLDVNNYNAISWAPVTGATSYGVYRTVGGATQGRIATGLTSAALNDTALVATALTAPTASPIIAGVGSLVVDVDWATAPYTDSVYAIIDDGTGKQSDVITRRAAEGGSYNGPDMLNLDAVGVIIHVSLSAKVGAGATTWKASLQYKGPGTGTYVTIWTEAGTMGAAGDYMFLLHPNGSQSAGAAYAGQFTEIVVGQLWRGTWRLVMTVGAAGDTYNHDIDVSYLD